MARLVALDARGAPFVDALRRSWADGDAVLPIDPRLPPAARAQLLDAARLHDPVEPGDALVVATSGSSGDPKLAVLTHAAVEASALATSARLRIDPSVDRWLACLPLSHVGGLSVVTRSLVTGTPCTVHDAFDAASVMRAATEGCTRTSLVPTALARIDAAAFRTILVGGQAPPRDRPPNTVATYGLTETGSGVVYDGAPLDGVELRTVADEIHVRAPMLLRTYRDGRDPKDADGWFATGDAGAWDGTRLTVHGRIGDVIVTGGENVWPAAVERVLASHPAVAEALVLGRPDPEWGERVVALVVPRDRSAPPGLGALRDHVKAELPAYAAPKQLEVVHELPRAPSGKTLRPRG
ncbi:MAG: class I adenylate-forming enzyme family protein [Acidimicrobiales bacterium]